jgi:hypothetical protein
MFDGPIPGTERLAVPALRSVLDETGTPESGYATGGPYHCEDCIHKTAKDEPFCIHPKVIGDSQLQDNLVQIDGRPAVKIDMERGCCRYVRQALKNDEEKNERKE